MTKKTEDLLNTVNYFPEQGEDYEDFATSCFGFLPNQHVATFAPYQVIKFNQTPQVVKIEDFKIGAADYKNQYKKPGAELKIKSKRRSF